MTIFETAQVTRVGRSFSTNILVDWILLWLTAKCNYHSL